MEVPNAAFNNNQIDVKTGTISVVGEFPNPKMILLPGMFATVRALLRPARELRSRSTANA